MKRFDESQLIKINREDIAMSKKQVDIKSKRVDIFERTCNFNKRMRNITFLIGCISFPLSLNYVGSGKGIDWLLAFFLGVFPLLLSVVHYIFFILGEKDESLTFGGINVDTRLSRLGSVEVPTLVVAKMESFDKHR